MLIVCETLRDRLGVRDAAHRIEEHRCGWQAGVLARDSDDAVTGT